MVTEVLKTKKQAKQKIKDIYKFSNKNKFFAIIKLSNEENHDNLIEWLKTLPANFVIQTDKDIESSNNVIFTKEISENAILGFDFALVDNNFENTNFYNQSWIVTLIPSNYYLKTIFTEFDPVNVTGNTFFYEENNCWSMFYAIVRFLENSKFTFDYKNLVKNVLNSN